MKTGLPEPALRLNTSIEVKVLNADSSFVVGEMGMVQQQMTSSHLGRLPSCADVK